MIKWLKFSNPKIVRMSKIKTSTEVAVVELKKPCRTFSECLWGCGPSWVTSLRPFQGPHHHYAAEGWKSSSPRARPAHIRKIGVAVRLLPDEIQCPGLLAFFAMIQVCASAQPALLILCTGVVFIFNPHPRIWLLIVFYFILFHFIFILILLQGYVFIDFRERGREHETEQHQCDGETSIGCLPYMPQLRIKSATFWVLGTMLQVTA